MSFEIIDNTFQVIVLAAMALLAFILAFRRSSRSCLILAFGYASFMMGTLYYLLHLIILGHGPQVFYVAECSWMASYFFFLSLLPVSCSGFLFLFRQIRQQASFIFLFKIVLIYISFFSKLRNIYIPVSTVFLLNDFYRISVIQLGDLIVLVIRLCTAQSQISAFHFNNHGWSCRT